MQLLGEGGICRVHGTVLHDDSLLWNLTHSPDTWTGRIYRAHRSYSDYSNILWPERFTERELRKRQKQFQDAKDPGGYSCEYLNDPRDREDAYLRKDWFIPLEDPERGMFRKHGVGVDLRGEKPLLLVCDRANRRLQHFDLDGKFVANVAKGLNLPCAVSFDGKMVAIAELEGDDGAAEVVAMVVGITNQPAQSLTGPGTIRQRRSVQPTGRQADFVPCQWHGVRASETRR